MRHWLLVGFSERAALVKHLVGRCTTIEDHETQIIPKLSSVEVRILENAHSPNTNCFPLNDDKVLSLLLSLDEECVYFFNRPCRRDKG